MPNALVQKAVGLPVGANRQELSAQKVSNPTSIVKNEATNTDFKSILMNSNFQEKKKREADAKGDLSGAKNYEDFLEKLNRQTKQKDAPKNNLDKNDFLKLFVTQLQAQDPLNPQDGTQMASQLAQFNGLEQMLNVNTTLEKMMAAQDSGRAMQYVNYIGKELSITGGDVRLEQGKTNDVFMSSPMPLGRATLTVKDAFGKIVAERELGALDQGDHRIAWDGKDNTGKALSNGKYIFDIMAKNGSGESVDLALSSRVQVTGVDLGEGGQNVYTSVGSIPFDKIKAVGSTGFTSAKVQEINAALQAKKAKGSEKDSNATQGVSGNSSVNPEEDPNSTTQAPNQDSDQDGAKSVTQAQDPLKQAQDPKNQAQYADKQLMSNGEPAKDKKIESSTSVPADELPPEIRKSLEKQFGGNSKTSSSQPGKISVTNPPIPKNEVKL